MSISIGMNAINFSPFWQVERNIGAVSILIVDKLLSLDAPIPSKK